MAEIIQNQTISPSSSVAESIITMTQTANKTESGLTVPFNQTATAQTITVNATTVSEAIFSLAQLINQTDISLTSSFNTQFVSQIVFDILLIPALSKNIGSFDEGGIPIIFYTRTSPEPIIFYSRTSPEPIIFYARGETQRHIDQGTTDKFTAPYNFIFEQGVPVVSSSKVASLISMDKTRDQTDTSLAASFSTSVA